MPVQPPQSLRAASGDQCFLKRLGQDDRMWCTEDQRSLRNADKAGMTGLQFFVFDGAFPLTQIVKVGTTSRALFEIPADVVG